jgi:proteic killer suppression protein
MEWKVIESRLIARQLPRVPREIQEKYILWRSLVQRHGPYLCGGFRVHALRGNRKGQKSARMNRQWRVIFRVFEGDLIVEALELTPHKY